MFSNSMFVNLCLLLLISSDSGPFRIRKVFGADQEAFEVESDETGNDVILTPEVVDQSSEDDELPEIVVEFPEESEDEQERPNEKDKVIIASYKGAGGDIYPSLQLLDLGENSTSDLQGALKRAPTFRLGKRDEEKRAPTFRLGKRDEEKRAPTFRLGKRDEEKRAPTFRLGKRDEEKRAPTFRLGKRDEEKRAPTFRLGKRAPTFRLGKRDEDIWEPTVILEENEEKRAPTFRLG